jgi:hypothetical protein
MGPKNKYLVVVKTAIGKKKNVPLDVKYVVKRKERMGEESR